jgi:hypothetical protein
MGREISPKIEVLLAKAAVDPAFRAVLLERRAAAAGEIGLELDAAETAILRDATAEQLEAIIARTTVPEEHRRVFLSKAGATMLVVVAGAAAVLSGLSLGHRPDHPPVDGGVRPDGPPVVGGIRPPERPVPSPEKPSTLPGTRGIRPDRPEPRSTSDTTP